jgi:hypothetical protein
MHPKYSVNPAQNSPLSKSEVYGSRLVSNHASSFREMLMRSAVIFSFCCYGHCRCRAQQAPPRFLFMARLTRSTTECAPSRLPHPPMAFSRAAGGAATTIRKLTSATDRPICVKGRLSRRPLSTGRALNSKISVGDSDASRGSQSKLRWEETS